MIDFRIWQIAGWTMLHYLWIGSVLGVVALAVRRRLRSRGANLRYLAAVGCFALLGIAPLPIAVVVTSGLPPPRTEPPVESEQVSAGMPPPLSAASAEAAAAAPPVLPSPATASASQPREMLRSALDRAAMGLPWLWLIGAPITFLVTTVGLLGAERLRRQSRLLEDSPVAETCRRLAAALGISRRVGVGICDRIAAPILVGIFRPLILLPAAALTGWDPQQLEMVLLHELAHVRRFDNLVNLVQRIVESLLFFHPLVWIVSSWVRREREHCCDELVVVRTRQPRAYAEMLVNLSERVTRGALRRPPLASSRAASSMAERPLVARIRRILKKEEQSMQVSRKTVGFVFGGLLALGVLIVGYCARPTYAVPDGASGDSQPASPGDTIEGVVVDEQGKPVAGATVRACERDGEDSTTTSNADGTFRLPVREPFVHNLALTASNRVNTRQALLTVGLQNKPCRLVLKPSHAVDVTVVDAGGQPVTAAPVAAIVWNGQVAFGATDAQGKARLDIPADARNVGIMAYKSGVGLDYFGGDDLTAMPDDPRYSPPDAARLVLDGAAPVEVRTVDAAGRPVSGLNVELVDMRKTSKNRFMAWNAKLAVKSDAQGRATFDWLPAKLDRISFSVSAKDSDYAEREELEFRATAGGDPRHLTARVVPTATFTGRVTFPDGKPAAGILLEAEGLPGKQAETIYYRGHARTNQDGIYRFKVTPNQDYIIAICDDHWAANSHLGLIAHEGEKREDLDFHLLRGTLIRGTVTVGTDHLPGNGKNLSYPVANLVQLGPPIPDDWKWPDLAKHGPEQYRTRLVRWSDIDEEGRYSTRVGPGEYYIDLPSERHNVIVRDQAELVIDDHLPEQTPKSLHGRVVDKAGKPVPNAVVAFPSNLHLTTDREGRFTTFGNLGPCRIHARSPEANLAGSQTIAKGDSNVTIEMLPAAAAAGRVLDAAGQPVSGVRVHYDFFLRPPAEHCWFPVDAETEKDGKYAMAGLPIGFQGDDVSVVWYNPAKKTYEVFNGPKFTVQPGENRLPDTILKPTAL